MYICIYIYKHLNADRRDPDGGPGGDCLAHLCMYIHIYLYIDI